MSVRCAFLALALCASACVVSQDHKGVANTWRDEDLPAFVRGETTQADVLERLGPPSQLIDLGDQIVFYYLLEETNSRGAITLVYNTRTQRVRYDRAIFFFDDAGILTEFALSDEAVDAENDE